MVGAVPMEGITVSSRREATLNVRIDTVPDIRHAVEA